MQSHSGSVERAVWLREVSQALHCTLVVAFLGLFQSSGWKPQDRYTCWMGGRE